MNLRNRKIPAPNFERGESLKNIIISQCGPDEPCNLIDLDIEDDVNLSTSSPTVNPINSSVQNTSTIGESKTKLNDNNIIAILMDIQRQLKNQNDRFSELKTEISEISTQVKLNQGNIAQLVIIRDIHVAENITNTQNCSQNSIGFTRTTTEQNNQVPVTQQLAANTSTNNPQYTLVSTNPIRVSSQVQQLQRDEPKPRSPLFNGQGKTEDFNVCRTESPTQYVPNTEFKTRINELMDFEDIKKDQFNANNSYRVNTCYSCHQEGHYSRYCPFSRGKRGKPENMNIFGGNPQFGFISQGYQK